MANTVFFIGATKRLDANETEGGNPSQNPVPCIWSCNQGNGSIVLAPVSPDAQGRSLKCDVTPVAGNAPQQGVVVTAQVDPNGPKGTFTFDTDFDVDTVTITVES